LFPWKSNAFDPLQDFSQHPPVQELVARDLHDNEWKFRHIFRGMYLNCGSKWKKYAVWLLNKWNGTLAINKEAWKNVTVHEQLSLVTYLNCLFLSVSIL
jgi:hypothetical protein